MPKMRWWILLILLVMCACGGTAAVEETEAAGEAALEPGPGSSEVRADPVEVSTDTPHPDTPREVVVALIEAFQAGDQARVESLWARDGGTWTDAAGFQARAAYYQKAEFDLDPESIMVDNRSGSPQVVVNAKQDDQQYVWSFFVLEIDGKLRAGGAEARLAGLP